jgi:hypothetical protein
MSPSSTELKSASLSPASSSGNDSKHSRSQTNVPLSCSGRIQVRLAADGMCARESFADWPGQLARVPLVGGFRLLAREVGWSHRTQGI